jgi:hypothetical protein
VFTLKDVLESFIAIRASAQDVLPFLTQLDRMTLWLSPLIGLGTGRDGWEELHGGEVMDLSLEVPGRPLFRCRVLSVDTDPAALRVGFEGAATGIATWHLVPSRGEVLLRHRIEVRQMNGWWAIPWSLVGRWAAILHMGWQMRRLKSRVEDTVGSSDFGVPLLVSTYALVAAAAGLVLLLARCAGKLCRSRCSHRE